MDTKQIPLECLKMDSLEIDQSKTRLVMENEIEGIYVEHVAISAKQTLIDQQIEGYKSIYMFIKGFGSADVGSQQYELVPETILLPNIARELSINAAQDHTLHYLKISTKLSPQDQLDLKELPAENTQNVYYAKFTDCRSYTEPIKSPNTISRTILSNKYIPRIAMGTVQAKGPDEVGAHKHPMLEQLFLGLSNNNCVVHADDAQVNFPPYSVLHIPLGSRHSVSVKEDETLYYVWMDFFLDKEGEEWLKTHNESE